MYKSHMLFCRRSVFEIDWAWQKLKILTKRCVERSMKENKILGVGTIIKENKIIIVGCLIFLILITSIIFNIIGWTGARRAPSVAKSPAQTGVFEVVRPLGESTVSMIDMAPRLDTLDGKTIAVVGHSFMANVTHPEIKNLILEKYPTATVYVQQEVGFADHYPPPGTTSKNVAAFQVKLQELGVDALISGNGG